MNNSLSLSEIRFVDISTKDHKRHKLMNQTSLCSHPNLNSPNFYTGCLQHLILEGQSVFLPQHTHTEGRGHTDSVIQAHDNREHESESAQSAVHSILTQRSRKKSEETN